MGLFGDDNKDWFGGIFDFISRQIHTHSRSVSA